MTGQPPFQELPSNEVESLYKANKFPELTEVLCGHIIRRCWHNEITSAQKVCNFIQTIVMEITCKVDNSSFR